MQLTGGIRLPLETSLQRVAEDGPPQPEHSPPTTTAEMPMDEDGEVVSDITYGDMAEPSEV